MVEWHRRWWETTRIFQFCIAHRFFPCKQHTVCKKVYILLCCSCYYFVGIFFSIFMFVCFVRSCVSAGKCITTQWRHWTSYVWYIHFFFVFQIIVRRGQWHVFSCNGLQRKHQSDSNGFFLFPSHLMILIFGKANNGTCMQVKWFF